MSFNEQLRNLSAKQKLAFAAAIAERMVPNYQIFAEANEPEVAQKLRAIMDTVWEKLTVPQSKIDFAKQAEKLLELQPNPDEDPSLASFLGLDCTLAVDHCLSTDEEQAVSISRLSRASVARFLEVAEPETAGAKLSEQPLMQYEHECQQEILEFLLDHSDAKPNEMKQLRQLIRDQEVSSIGIER